MTVREVFAYLPGQLYFAVEPPALREAIAGALGGADATDATLTIDERLAAAHLGVYKQDQVGARWSLLVPPDTWETVDEHGFSDHLVMPLERMLRLLAGRLRYTGSVPTAITGALLVPLGCEREEAAMAFSGRMLSRTLDPPQPPDEVLSFPPELNLVEASQADTCRRLVEVATQRYFALDGEAFTTIARMLGADGLQEADRIAMAYLATLHSVARSLEEGNDVLVTRIL